VQSVLASRKIAPLERFYPLKAAAAKNTATKTIDELAYLLPWKCSINAKALDYVARIFNFAYPVNSASFKIYYCSRWPNYEKYSTNLNSDTW